MELHEEGRISRPGSRAGRVLGAAVACLLAGCSATDADRKLPAGATGSSRALAWSPDGTALFWSDAARAAIVRQEPGGPAAVIASAQPSQQDVAVTETDVLWVGSAEGKPAVFRLPLAGGAATLAARVSGGGGIAADTDYLYFSRVSEGLPGGLYEQALASGAERSLSDTFGLGIALAGGDLIGTNCNLAGDGVFRIHRSGGQRQALVADAHCPLSVLVDDSHVYFMDAATGGNERSLEALAVFTVPLEGGAARQLVTDVDRVPSFAVRDGFVYARRGGSIVRVNVASGARTTLAVAPEAVGIAVGDRDVYWTEPGPSGFLELRRAPLPK